jgi:Family of unknown function (DUF6235)
MATPTQPTGDHTRSGFRLTSGLDLLEEWSRTAAQAEKNLVHDVLFAVADGSVFTGYDVVDDVERALEFFVLARHELTVKIRVHSLESFGIVYIGPTCDAPGLDRAAPEPATHTVDEQLDAAS